MINLYFHISSTLILCLVNILISLRILIRISCWLSVSSIQLYLSSHPKAPLYSIPASEHLLSFSVFFFPLIRLSRFSFYPLVVLFVFQTNNQAFLLSDVSGITCLSSTYIQRAEVNKTVPCNVIGGKKSYLQMNNNQEMCTRLH